MPGLWYLSQSKKPIFTAEWQVWVFLGVVVAGIIAIAIAVWKTRK
jgi:hypothetical protein